MKIEYLVDVDDIISNAAQQLKNLVFMPWIVRFLVELQCNYRDLQLRGKITDHFLTM